MLRLRGIAVVLPTHSSGIMLNLTRAAKIAHFQAQYATANVQHRPQS